MSLCAYLSECIISINVHLPNIDGFRLPFKGMTVVLTLNPTAILIDSCHVLSLLARLWVFKVSHVSFIY